MRRSPDLAVYHENMRCVVVVITSFFLICMVYLPIFTKVIPEPMTWFLNICVNSTITKSHQKHEKVPAYSLQYTINAHPPFHNKVVQQKLSLWSVRKYFDNTVPADVLTPHGSKPLAGTVLIAITSSPKFLLFSRISCNIRFIELSQSKWSMRSC